MKARQIQAKDLMTPQPISCTPSTTLAEAARKMAEGDCGALPVVDATETAQPLGVITDRDIVCRSLAVGKNPMNLIAFDCMSGPAVTVPDFATLAECCETMEANQIRRLVVVDVNGRCVGIVSQADVAKAASEAKTAEVLREISLPNAQVGVTF
jgi:CBS domain-containing protein